MLLCYGNRYDAVTRQLLVRCVYLALLDGLTGVLLMHANINGPAVPVMLFGKATDMMQLSDYIQVR